jgi:hypothetical protein
MDNKGKMIDVHTKKKEDWGTYKKGRVHGACKMGRILRNIQNGKRIREHTKRKKIDTERKEDWGIISGNIQNWKNIGEHAKRKDDWGTNKMERRLWNIQNGK